MHASSSDAPVCALRFSCRGGWLTAAAVAATLLVAGCGSGPKPRGREAQVPKQALEGSADFFAATVVARVRIDPIGGLGPARGDGENRSGRGGGRSGPPMGGGGGMGGGPGGGMGGGGGPGGGPPPERESGGEAQAAPQRLAGGPAVMIYLSVENKTDRELVVSAREFSSVFGNFAVQPEKLTVPAGAKVAFEAMSSATAVYADVSAKLTLVGAGQRETQTVALKIVPFQLGPPPDIAGDGAAPPSRD